MARASTACLLAGGTRGDQPVPSMHAERCGHRQLHRATRRHLRRRIHASDVRSIGGLPVPQRLDTAVAAGRQSACHGLAARWQQQGRQWDRSRYDGTILASHGVIVVTANYRLEAMGFFSHPELTAESPPTAQATTAFLIRSQRSSGCSRISSSSVATPPIGRSSESRRDRSPRRR